MFFVCFNRIIPLVAMATYSFHRLIMGKVEIYNFFLSQLGYLDLLTHMSMSTSGPFRADMGIPI